MVRGHSTLLIYEEIPGSSRSGEIADVCAVLIEFASKIDNSCKNRTASIGKSQNKVRFAALVPFTLVRLFLCLIFLHVKGDEKYNDLIIDMPADNVSTAVVGDNHNDSFLRF